MPHGGERDPRLHYHHAGDGSDYDGHDDVYYPAASGPGMMKPSVHLRCRAHMCLLIFLDGEEHHLEICQLKQYTTPSIPECSRMLYNL